MALIINIIRPTDTITDRIIKKTKNNCPPPADKSGEDIMKSRGINFTLFINTPMLTRFVRQVRSLSDTPALIRLIAADAGCLMVCRAIVNDSSHRKQETIRSIKTVCRLQGLDFQLLQEKLLPAARALGLTLSSNAQLDYYTLLGVSPEADTLRLKELFGQKPMKFIPTPVPRAWR